MNDLGVWKTIKIGFWLGIGFIIPSMTVMYGGTALTFLFMPAMMEASFSSETDDPDDSMGIRSITSKFDRTSQIEIGDYRDTGKDGQLLILGTITNIGDKSIGSIQLEAELFNNDDKFVYECSEYISNKLKAGGTENFQIKCGCGSSPVPEYKSVKVRVVSANSF